MQPNYMQATMENIFSIWKAPVNLATVMDAEGKIFSYDGKEFKSEAYGDYKIVDDDEAESEEK
jgi:stage V sporulation protein R